MLTNSDANTACRRLVTTSITGKSAVTRRFFCVLASLFLGQTVVIFTLYPSRAWSEQAPCSDTNPGEAAQVKHVIDGDTIVLTDRRKIRLIGIDTPETGHDGRASEPGADRARDFLARMLPVNTSVKLVYDQQHTDRYGRTLAHLFLPDDSNVQAILLRNGLALPLTIPPNLQFTTCYRRQTEAARGERKGLWALPRYQPLPVTKLEGTERGYHLLSGTVSRVSESRSSLWITLDGSLAVRIRRPDLRYFDGMQLHGLSGVQVRVQGWLYRRNNELRMQLRHPVDLEITAAGN